MPPMQSIPRPDGDATVENAVEAMRPSFDEPAPMLLLTFLHGSQDIAEDGKSDVHYRRMLTRDVSAYLV